jgi:hypothetical protein
LALFAKQGTTQITEKGLKKMPATYIAQSGAQDIKEEV